MDQRTDDLKVRVLLFRLTKQTFRVFCFWCALAWIVALVSGFFKDPLRLRKKSFGFAGLALLLGDWFGKSWKESGEGAVVPDRRTKQQSCTFVVGVFPTYLRWPPPFFGPFPEGMKHK